MYVRPLGALAQDESAAPASLPALGWTPILALGAAGGLATLLAARAGRRGMALTIGAGTVAATATMYLSLRPRLPALVPAAEAEELPVARPAALGPGPALLLAPIAAAVATVAPVLAPALAPAAATVMMTEGSAAAVVPAAARPAAAAPAAAPMPVQTFHLSDRMLAKFSQKAVEQVIGFFNTPLEASFRLSPEVAVEWASYRAGEYADYGSWTIEQTPATTTADYNIVANSEALDAATGAQSAGVEATGASTSAYGNLTVALKVLGVVGVLVDIGFTIAGDQPTALKAINVALDVAILVFMFIPGIGQVIAVVLAIVKALLGLFGSSLFGGGESHAVREMREVQRTLEQASGLARELGQALSPRELVRTLWRWQTGYCGGVTPLAIMASLTDPEGGYLLVAKNPCYQNQASAGLPGHYREWADSNATTLDDQAIALLKYGQTDLTVSIQAGVSPSYLSGPDWTLADGVKKKAAAWYEMMTTHQVTLDHLDVLAAEHRKQPRLHQIATFYGFEDWHALMGWHLQDLWTRYQVTNRQGTLLEFAQRLGYPDWIRLRDFVADSYGLTMDQVLALRDRIMAWGRGPLGTTLVDPLAEPFTPLAAVDDVSPQAALAARLRALGGLVTTIEGRCGAWRAAVLANYQQMALAQMYPSL